MKEGFEEKVFETQSLDDAVTEFKVLSELNSKIKDVSFIENDKIVPLYRVTYEDLKEDEWIIPNASHIGMHCISRAGIDEEWKEGILTEVSPNQGFDWWVKSSNSMKGSWAKENCRIKK